MKALIIGVAGLVGSNLERACEAKGIKVYGAGIKPAPERLYIDITRPDSARILLSRP